VRRLRLLGTALFAAVAAAAPIATPIVLAGKCHCSRRGRPTEMPSPPEASDDRDVVERRGEGVPPHRRPRRELRARQAWYGACSSAAASPDRGRRGREHSYAGPIRGRPSQAPPAPPPVAGGDHPCTLMMHPRPSGRHRGLGRRDSTQRPLPSAADQLLARQTISCTGQSGGAVHPGEFAAHVSTGSDQSRPWWLAGRASSARSDRSRPLGDSHVWGPSRSYAL
jgi:hypothetical protein